MAEVAQEPPQPFRAAHRPVGDHEDAGADARVPGGEREPLGVGQRMPASTSRRIGQVRVDVEEAGAGNVPGNVELASAVRPAELPATVDELVLGYQLPVEGGNATEPGWIT